MATFRRINLSTYAVEKNISKALFSSSGKIFVNNRRKSYQLIYTPLFQHPPVPALWENYRQLLTTRRFPFLLRFFIIGNATYRHRSTICQPFLGSFSTILSAMASYASLTAGSLAAAGRPISPPSIIDITIGTSPSRSIPARFAKRAAPPLPKM